MQPLLEPVVPVPVHAHPSPQCLSKVAVNDGIPLRLRANTLFFNLRQKLFTRKRKRADDLQRYGGSENCNKYGDSKGWHDLLYHLQDKSVGAWIEEDSLLRVVRSDSGQEYLKSIGLNTLVMDAYKTL